MYKLMSLNFGIINNYRAPLLIGEQVHAQKFEQNSDFLPSSETPFVSPHT